MDKSVKVRKGTSEDSSDFVSLFLMSDDELCPFLFSPNPKKIVADLFIETGNLFSFEHSHFVEIGGKKVGMMLGYSGAQKRKEEVHTGILLMKILKARFVLKLPYFKKVENIIGKISKNEYYISNIAVYPKFRGQGIAENLLLEAQKEAVKNKNNGIILEVKANNKRAIRLYKKLGYVFRGEVLNLRLKRKNIKFLKMENLFET